MLTIVGARIINGKSLENAIVQAFKEWAETDINEDHWRYQFLEREWDYDYDPDRPTIRENRAKYPVPVTSPRNIEDWGNLYQSGLDSYEYSFSGTRAEVYWHWNATNGSGMEYAYYVHEGTGTNRTARPFTDDISVASSFWEKDPGQALKIQMQTAMTRLNVRSSQ